MKSLLTLCLCIVLFTPISSAQDDSHAPETTSLPRIEDCRTGKDIDVKQLVSDLSLCDVLFLGEQHDNDSGHQFQLDVIRELVEQGHQVVVSTEQFERDVQGSLDDYLSGRIDEDEFLKTSRPWKNYEQHYRPIIEFAKEHKIPVLAGNIPRRIASYVATGKDIEISDQPFVPRSSVTTKNAYWQNFVATMRGHMGAEGSEKLDWFFASQCLKDDAMAETITDYLATNSHRQQIVVHLCGHFHSDYGLGTVARVIQRNPLLHYSIVTMEKQPTSVDKAELAKIRSRGHTIFWSVENPKPESTSNSK